LGLSDGGKAFLTLWESAGKFTINPCPGGRLEYNEEERKMNEAKLKELFSDEAFMTSLLKLETPEEVQKALKAKGLELSIEEIKYIGAVLEKAAEKGGTLNEADLEKVAGGIPLASGAAGALLGGALALSAAIGVSGLIAGAFPSWLRRW
jgi:hypothetical protein